MDPTKKPNYYRDQQDVDDRLSRLEQLASSPVVVDDPALGIVLRSPNLHYWRLTIDNAGSPTWTDIGLDRP